MFEHIAPHHPAAVVALLRLLADCCLALNDALSACLREG
jgi:hypothetical protein